MLHVPALICLWDQQGKSQWAWHAAVMDRQEVRDAGASAQREKYLKRETEPAGGWCSFSHKSLSNKCWL